MAFLLFIYSLKSQREILELVPIAITSGTQISLCVGWRWESDAGACKPGLTNADFQMCLPKLRQNTLQEESFQASGFRTNHQLHRYRRTTL